MAFASSFMLFGVIVTTSDAVVMGARSVCRRFVGNLGAVLTRGAVGALPRCRGGGTMLNVGHPWRLCRQGYSHHWRWHAMLHVGNP